ncbi:MAG: FliH/SctL family protein [Planctomycetota bacterium]|jgi:flagellar biosynthesis/type III secretory pathway protein FliH
MPQTVTIQLEKPIASAKLLDGFATTSAEAKQAQLLKLQQEGLTQACRALQDAANKVNEFQDNLFEEHKEQIAKLSVEIARKILVQKVQEKDYEIESIIKEALKNAPTHQDVVVHLNPEDFVQCQKLQQDDTAGTLAGVKFVSDPNIGEAECLLETPKGIIESLIDKHLEQIGQALKKAE